jgi:hypothetical protein
MGIVSSPRVSQLPGWPGFLYAARKKNEKMMIEKILDEVKAELLRAGTHNNAFNSAHEGYAVLKEEVDELWAEVKENERIEA